LRRSLIADDHCDDVETVRFRFNAQHSSIDAGGARDLPTLAQINVDLRRREPIGRASFYFDKAKCFAIVSDEIDLSVYDSIAQVSSNRQSEISCDETIAALLEVSGCVSFTELAE